jgi:hypothetical protein
MRKDKGLNGELDRLPQLTWIIVKPLLDALISSNFRVSDALVQKALQLAGETKVENE